MTQTLRVEAIETLDGRGCQVYLGDEPIGYREAGHSYLTEIEDEVLAALAEILREKLGYLTPEQRREQRIAKQQAEVIQELKEEYITVKTDCTEYYALWVTRNGQHLWSGPYPTEKSALSQLTYLLKCTNKIVVSRKI